MKVCVSVRGRFHAFYLAAELQRAGFLSRLITSYPKFEVKKYDISPGRVKSLVVHELLARGWKKMPSWIRNKYNTQYLFHELFDYHAAHYLPAEMDIFVGWSSNALHTLRRAKKMGAKKIVLERGSSHIVYQQNIMREEYDRLGIPFPNEHHFKITEKELLEYQEADYISVPSGFVKRTFLEEGVPENKIIHVPYGVNLTHFFSAEKKDSVFRIIFCGQLSVRKGIYYLLRAFKELHLPNSELWLIGGKMEETGAMMREFAAPNIIYKGIFPEFELAKQYTQGSVFCLPSLEEGLAMVIPQAMACGLPVICTTNTGGADIVREGQEGYILPTRDIEKLKEKILFLYEHPEACKQMGQAAAKRVSSGFSWYDYGQRMIERYQRILAK